MKTASWVMLAVAGALTLLGSLVSMGVAYSSAQDQIGPASLAELSGGRPEVATAVRAWWALLAGTLVVSLLILLRVPLLGIRLGAPAAVTGAGTALTTLVQLVVVGLGLALDAGRLGGSSRPA